MEIAIKALQLILSLSILVVLHELGHFIPARLFKTRVEKFYLFFDPWFSLVKKKIGDTEYGVGWLPLGGYVKISGMIDESMDKEQMKLPPKEWEFRSKPAWQRLVIMLGGVTVNVVLAIFIYSMLLFNLGDTYLANEDLHNGVICSDFAKSIGFQNGDKIITVDGQKIDRFEEINGRMILQDNPFEVAVERGEGYEIIPIEKNFVKQWKNNSKEPLFSPRTRVEVSSIIKGSSAEENGILKGDILTSVNGVKTEFFDEFRLEVEKNKGLEVTVGLIRGGDDMFVSGVGVSENAQIGFYPNSVSGLKMTTVEFGFFSSFVAGYNLSIKKLSEYIGQFSLIFNSDNELASEIGGFGAIGNLFPSTWNWPSFWYLTAFLSLMLAFLNLLPIPALDGGHVAFLLYEILSGKPAPEKVVERAQLVGFILLLALVIFANGNDIIKLF